MNSTSIELELPSDAMSFVRQCLQQGGELAAAVLQSVDLERGRVVALVPRDTSRERATRLEEGGLLPLPPQSEWLVGEQDVMVRTPSLTADLAKKLTAFLGRNDGVCLIEDVDGYSSGGASGLPSRLLRTWGNELLLGLGADDSSAELAARAYEVAYSLPVFVSVWSPRLSQHLLAEGPELSDDFVAAVVAHAHSVVLGAYDAESYAIWERR